MYVLLYKLFDNGYLWLSCITVYRDGNLWLGICFHIFIDKRRRRPFRVLFKYKIKNF